jgi:malonyl CoA-acyl carrier protein transacylase
VLPLTDWLPSPPLSCTGPKEKLDTTAVSQPAIYVASLAAVEKIRATEGQVGGALGLPAGALLVHCWCTDITGRAAQLSSGLTV